MRATRARSRTTRSLVATLRGQQQAVGARLAALDRRAPLHARDRDTGDNTPIADPLEESAQASAAEVDLAARAILDRRLRALVRAEDRLRRGTYGICGACRRPIPPARLRAVPEAVLCVACAAAREERRGPRPRSG